MKPSMTHPFRTSVICEHEKYTNRNRFNPDREFVSQAVEDFLKAGGQVKPIVVKYNDNIPQSTRLVDEWLLEN